MSVRRVLLRVFNAFDPLRRESDLSREIGAHLALLEADFQRRGMSADAARAAARRALGSTTHIADLHRDARSFVWLDDLRWDLGYAARLLRRNPLFALTAVISLAIGIGANTTIFSVVNVLLFREPPGVAEPERLVDIGRSVRRANAFNPGSYPDYLDIRSRATTLEGVYASTMFPHAMSLATADTGGAERVFAMPVTSNYFTVLGVRPAAGRLFDANDSEQPGASPIVVLSHRFWTRRFNQHHSVVGQIVRLNDRPFTVVGVAPDGFQGTGVRSSEVWIPITMTASGEGTSTLTDRSAAILIMGARLKPDVSISQAAAEVDAIGKALERDYPADDGGKGLRLLASSPVPGNSGPIAVFLGLLMGIVSIVLVVACANLAGVLLARATARRREIAVRLAIGAGRARLIRQLLTETLMLFAIGAAAGLLLAGGMTSVVSSLVPMLPFSIDMNLALDGRVIAFTAVLSLAASLACGLAPALQASRPDVVSTLKDDAQGPAGRSRLRHAFLVAQIALSIVLVVVAGLFTRALQRVSASDPGFDPHGVELASVDLRIAGYNDTTAPVFARTLVERVRQRPDVQAATIAAVLPGGFERMSLAGIAVPGVTAPNGQHLFSGDWNIVEPGYFSTLRMPLIAGRDFTDADGPGAPLVAIIGAGAAHRFWPGQDAVGKQIVQEEPGRSSTGGKPTKTLLVVGVAQDPTYGTLFDNTTGVYIYVPLQQQYHAGFTMIVARSTRGQSLTNELRAVVASANPNLPIANAQRAEDYTSLGLLPQRIAASVAGSLGLVGLLLAAVGIYGVTAYAVTRRTREFGVRIALGATRRNIVGMVLSHGLGLAAAGSAIGLLLAAAASRLLTTFLFGVTPIDPLTFTSAALLFALAGLAACYVPARRATRIDAMEALRYE